MPLINMLSPDKRPNGTQSWGRNRSRRRKSGGKSSNTHDTREVSRVQNMTINQQCVPGKGKRRIGGKIKGKAQKPWIKRFLGRNAIGSATPGNSIDHWGLTMQTSNFPRSLAVDFPPGFCSLRWQRWVAGYTERNVLLEIRYFWYFSFVISIFS